MDRLISEQAVLEVINNAILLGRFYYGKERTIEEIKTIPSSEPREVLYSGDGYADGEMVYDMANCPNCNYEFEESNFIWGCKFCPECGQALKWEDEE